MNMADLKRIKVDNEKIESGVWVDYVEDIQLCIANINNPAYKEARKKALKPHLRQMRLGKIESDQVLDILKPAVAKHVLLGWKNIEEDNKPLEYSSQKALELFKDPEMFTFFDFVLETASENEFFKQDMVEDGVKN